MLCLFSVSNTFNMFFSFNFSFPVSFSCFSVNSVLNLGAKLFLSVNIDFVGISNKSYFSTILQNIPYSVCCMFRHTPHTFLGVLSPALSCPHLSWPLQEAGIASWLAIAGEVTVSCESVSCITYSYIFILSLFIFAIAFKHISLGQGLSIGY